MLEGNSMTDITSRPIAALFAAGFGALMIAAAPTASAAAVPSCVDSGASTVCQKPGNAQITNAKPDNSTGPFSMYGPFFWYDRGRGGAGG
jgi:hypothetical protein